MASEFVKTGVAPEGLEQIMEMAEAQAADSISLTNGSLGEADVAAIADLLNARLPSLRRLVLSGNRGDDRGAVQLGSALSDPECGLELLHLGSNGIADWGADTLGKALAANVSLTSLFLGGNRIDAWGCQGLAEGLSQNSTLTQLDLNSNKITPQGFEPLADALAENPAIKWLNLSGNCLGDSGGAMLGKALQQNSSLRFLKVNECAFRADGVVAMAAGIRAHGKLESVMLSRNPVGDHGAAEMAAACCATTSCAVLGMDQGSGEGEG
eukprot:TRINITY_DN15375_c0_g3_i1.p1 TRINITY_DN15375_c0_g3~~TRINITY_DN15375_c0_g3_i1.p1  ORF type:complete len:268 (-),score=64.17 TRINITY_DN15375_c0_g3_i1:10-813(-)